MEKFKKVRAYRKYILACFCAFHGVLFTEVNAQQKPNIVFILTDDQRLQGTIHALGGNEIITPNIDHLVKAGTVFTNAYIMGGNQPAVCTPSRNMIMTGRNLFSIDNKGKIKSSDNTTLEKVAVQEENIFNVGIEISSNNTTLGESLGKNGYSTYGIGKWHNDIASYNRSFQNGDEIFFGGMSKNPNNVGLFHYDKLGNYISSLNIQNGDHSNPKHHTEVFGEAAVKYIENYQTGKPFFLYIAFKSPHDPRIMPDKYKAMYDTGKISLPKNFMPRHPFDNGELKIRDELLTGFPRNPSEIKMHIRDYYAMMTHMDEQIGKIIDALKAKGLYKNTIIVFAGDNGLALGQHGLMGKQSVYEHSIKVPLIFSGKNIPKGKINTSFVYLLDIFPTLCNLTNTTVPSSVQGQAILKKNLSNRRTSMFYAYRDFQRAVRMGDWKMIVYHVKGHETIQLFNLKKDPLEMNNLANDPQFKTKLAAMKLEMAKQKKMNNDQ